MKEAFKINIVENKHVFEVLDTKSQTEVFTEIVRFSDGVMYYNTIKNRKEILKRLSVIDKEISMSRFLAILKEISDKEMLIWEGKGKYKINQEYIEKL